MGWLRLVGSLKLYVSFAEYCLFYRALLPKRPIILRSLLIVAIPYQNYLGHLCGPRDEALHQNIGKTGTATCRCRACGALCCTREIYIRGHANTRVCRESVCAQRHKHGYRHGHRHGVIRHSKCKELQVSANKYTHT